MDKHKYQKTIAKILAKTMESSYRKNELFKRMNTVVDKMEMVIGFEDNNESLVELRQTFEEIKRQFYKL